MSSAPEQVKEMPSEWSKIDKSAFGRSNNYLSIILAVFSFIIIGYCLWYSKDLYKYKLYSYKYATLSAFMFVLAAVAFGLNVTHTVYEDILNEHILPDDQYPIPAAMAGVLMVFFFFKFVCESNKTYKSCIMSDNKVVGSLSWVAAIVLGVFSVLQTVDEEPLDYGNLAIPVPEMKPIV